MSIQYLIPSYASQPSFFIAGVESASLSFFAGAQNDKGERRMTGVVDQTHFTRCAESGLCWNQ